MNRVALVGQRGVGKSTLLERIATYHREAGLSVVTLDLDREIERRLQRTVSDIFSKDGESRFREIERETFEAIHKSAGDKKVFLSCGAGFDPENIPLDWKVVWIRRPSDMSGRVFTDRPRLDRNVSPLREYFDRAKVRELRFDKRADEVLWLDEGLEASDPAERAFWLEALGDVGGAITVLPEHFARDFRSWAERWVERDLSVFELRDDVLTQDQIRFALDVLPREKALLSFRSRDRIADSIRLVDQHALKFDWPLELGHSDLLQKAAIVSLHKIDSVANAEIEFQKAGLQKNQILKLALHVSDFKELEAGEVWRKQDSRRRSFLPMSDDGRWAWYRQSLGSTMPINFIRESRGSSLDQPTLLQWVRNQGLTNDFAAVLGDPVAHSRSPIEHARFSTNRRMAFYSIRIRENEFTSQTLKFLGDLGLKNVSVTAPLKKLAFALCDSVSNAAQQLRSVNTMKREGSKWIGHNTDLDGFQELSRLESDLGVTAVWGGGGTLPVIQSVLPQAELFSIRTGENRDASRVRASEYRPDTVVWAIGREKDRSFAHPPDAWKPKLVLDLNYSESSPGREYALEVTAKYISGIKMFLIQAEAQRIFWSK